MEVVVPGPIQVTYFLIGLPLFITVVALALRGKPILHRILMVLVVSAACLTFYLLAMGPMRFSWDEKGIVDATFQDPIHIAWSDIREARLIPNYERSEFRPSVRTMGTAYAGYGAGNFRLANGMNVRVFLTPETNDALLITTGNGTYLYAPPHFELFRREVETRKAP